MMTQKVMTDTHHGAEKEIFARWEINFWSFLWIRPGLWLVNGIRIKPRITFRWSAPDSSTTLWARDIATQEMTTYLKPEPWNFP